MEKFRKKDFKSTKGITLIALVVTIIILLILAGISIAMLMGNNGVLTQGKRAKEETLVGQEKEQVEMAYVSAAINKLGENVTANELQTELDKVASTEVSTNSDGTLNVIFINTKNNYNVNKGKVEKVERTSTIAMFDTGINTATKIRKLALGGNISIYDTYVNVSVNAIKKYDNTPDLSSMTDDNIVSWTEGYTAYEQNPNAYSEIIPKGTKLCPIYMWFEESGETEIRDIWGNLGITSINNEQTIETNTGTIYWWSESDDVYLNPDSSKMFVGLPYLEDINGLCSLRTNYTSNMSMIFCVISNNQKLKNFDSLSNWNTGNVTNMEYAFAGYKNLESIEGLKDWNTSKVTNMHGMFGGDYDVGGSTIKYTTPLKKWDVSNVVDMGYLFFGTRSIRFGTNVKLGC